MDESHIPIDINIGKLQDWLVSRRHVNKNWQTNVLEVREKINNAIQDMPVHEDIAQLLSGTHITYFHCLKIIEILKETERNTKNLFGRYGSQRMKDWLDITKSYENDNIYLAEAAQMLARNVAYEIPSLKKQIAKEEQLQAECDKKAADYSKNEAASRSEFNTMCKQLGIVGEKIKKELLQRLQQLPSIYNEIGSSLSPLHPAIDFYSAFIDYMLGNKAPPVLPLLKYVVEHGNTTVYEWSYGEAPLTLDPDPIHIESDDEETNGDQIDFGNDIDFGAEAPNVIDFGDGNVDIDWGNMSADNSQDEDLSVNMAEITLEESGIVVESQGVSGGVARGKDALTMLDNPSTRNQIIDQIVELESFLKMRLYEMSSMKESQGFTLVAELPTESVEALTGMLDAVQVALTRLLHVDITHLHNVKHSPRYVDILTAQLKQKLTLCDKMRGLKERVAESRAQSATREASLRPLLQRVVANTKQLQTNVASEISKKYKGRPVNIIGGVTFL